MYPKLNAKYKQDLKTAKTFLLKDGVAYKFEEDSWYSKDYSEEVIPLTDKEGSDAFIIESLSHEIDCCGITELNFLALQDYWFKFSKDRRKSALVLYLAKQFEDYNDARVCLAGLPIKTGEHSDYSSKAYKEIRKYLLEWGFTKMVRRPYKNKNSQNTIDVLWIQLTARRGRRNRDIW